MAYVGQQTPLFTEARKEKDKRTKRINRKKKDKGKRNKLQKRNTRRY